MFKNLLNFWKGKEFMTQVLDEFGAMLNDAHAMYNWIGLALLKGQEKDDLADRVYALDLQINGREKDIRRQVVKHLAMQPSVDVGACLILMSVVKDAERLGDYSKNLLEITELLKEPANHRLFHDFFWDSFERINGTFSLCREAFVNSDEEKARRIMDEGHAVTHQCDEIIEKLAASSLSANEAVCAALMARYFKRIMAHLMNISSSVVMPITDIDFSGSEKAQEGTHSGS